VSESLRSRSANTQLKGRDNPHLLGRSQLLPLDPRTRPKPDPPLNLLYLFLCRGTDPSPPLQSKKLCGMLSPSRLARDLAELSPRPVFTAVLALVSLLSISLSCMGRECPSGCCVILQSALFVLRLICPPFCFMPDDGTHQRHLYLIVSIHPSLRISSRVCVFLSSLTRCCVRSLLPLLSLLSYVHIIFLPLNV
jgi:hypothetical protein